MINQKDMKVMQFPSKYVQGKNAIHLLPQYVEQMGGKSLIVTTKSQYELVNSIMATLSRIEIFGGECSYEEQIMLLANDIAKNDPSQFSHHEPYSFNSNK